MKDIQFWCKEGHDNFESDMTTCTLLGWDQEYDSKGRALRADPNCQTTIYKCKVCGKEYTRIQCEWRRMFYEGVHGCWISHKGESYKKPDFEIDIAPDYLKDKKEESNAV